MNTLYKIIAIIAVAILVIMFLVSFVSQNDGGCINGHYITVHHAPSSYIMVDGNTPVTVFKSAYDTEEKVCDRRLQ